MPSKLLLTVYYSQALGIILHKKWQAVLKSLLNFGTIFLSKHKKCITTSHNYKILCDQKCVQLIFWIKTGCWVWPGDGKPPRYQPVSAGSPCTAEQV